MLGFFLVLFVFGTGVEEEIEGGGLGFLDEEGMDEGLKTYS